MSLVGLAVPLTFKGRRSGGSAPRCKSFTGGAKLRVRYTTPQAAAGDGSFLPIVGHHAGGGSVRPCLMLFPQSPL